MTSESQTIRESRAAYFDRTGFSTDAYEARLFPVRIGPLRLPFPNPGLLPLHDLHHVLTGYDTGLIGEAEISAFELRTGCRSPIVFVLCVGSLAIGLLLAPRRIVRAWRDTRNAVSLYSTTKKLDELLDMDVIALRRELGIPAGGYASDACMKRRSPSFQG